MDKTPERAAYAPLSADALMVRQLRAENSRLRALELELTSLIEQRDRHILELEETTRRGAVQGHESLKLSAENSELRRELARAKELATHIRRAYEARARETEGEAERFEAALPAPEVARSERESLKIAERYELKLGKIRVQKEECERRLQSTQVICSRQETELHWLRAEFRRLNGLLEETQGNSARWRAEANQLQHQLSRAFPGEARAQVQGATPAPAAPSAKLPPVSREVTAAYNELAALQGELEQEKLKSADARRALEGGCQNPAV